MQNKMFCKINTDTLLANYSEWKTLELAHVQHSHKFEISHIYHVDVTLISIIFKKNVSC